MLHFAASALVLHCLRMFHKNGARLKWVRNKNKTGVIERNTLYLDSILTQNNYNQN